MVLTWENKSRVPDIYFSWSEDFDYRKYVEEKSHFDEVVLAVDRSTTEIVGSADRLTHRIGEGVQILSGSIDQVGQVMEKGFDVVQAQLGDIDSTLDKGFSAISFNLETIDSSIQDLALICDLGFNKVAAQTARSNELLEDLISLIKTPDQVWAREQYEYAKECMSRDLWEDALGFADKAINGDDRNSGLYIEPVFHFLRGDILLHYPEVGEGNEFVEKALESFMNGAKYCGKKQQELKALCLLRASWCHYCLGDRASAIETVEQAQKLNDTPLGDFHLAKYKAADGDGGFSFPLLQAILWDELLYVRAFNDADFNKGTVDLETTAKHALETRKNLFNEYINHFFKYDEVKEFVEIADKAEVTGHDWMSVGELKKILSRIDELREDQTLSSLNDFLIRGGDEKFSSEAERLKERADVLTEDLKGDVSSSIERLMQASYHKLEANLETGSKFFSSDEPFLGWAALIACGGIFLITMNWGWHWFFSLVAIVFLGGPLSFAVRPILQFIAEMKDASDAKDTQAQQQQKFDVENEKNKRAASEKNSFGRDLNARFDKWTSQRSEKGTSKGRGCDNCNGMGQIRVQDGFFTQANACPDCS